MTDETQGAAPARPAAQAPTPAPPVSSAIAKAPPIAVMKTADGKEWSSALVISGGPGPDATEKRPVIVVESRTDDGKLSPNITYPGGQAVYFRSGDTADSATFPQGSNVVTMGKEVEQGLMNGFSGVQGIVHIGPSHPAYAAANIAYLNGAKDIEVRGLSPVWKARLQPWFDRIPTDPVAPAAVNIKLT